MNYSSQTTEFLQGLLFQLINAATAAGLNPMRLDAVREIDDELMKRQDDRDNWVAARINT